MSQLAYMTRRGACIVLFGTCAELGAKMMRLKTSATLRSNRGAVVGKVFRCDGSCDAPCPGKGWHYFYDPDGDETEPDEDDTEVES